MAAVPSLNDESNADHESPINCIIDKETASISTAAAITTEGEVARSTNSSIDSINNLVASATANRDNIVTQECFIASGYKEGEEKQEGEKQSLSNDKGNANIKETTSAPCEEEINTGEEDVATAPSDLDNVPPLIIAPTASSVVQYPQLQRYRYEESATSVVYNPTDKINTKQFRLSPTKLEPLTQEQRYQYYYCPSLAMVQQFEMEFLMNSLLETYENDALYAALQEYYNGQSKLTMNLHDVKKFRKEAEAAQEHIWIEVPIQMTFSNQCGDKIDVKETVTYK